jgi:Arc/MetJ-type ribon-helix-helix transcriptional regulator
MTQRCIRFSDSIEAEVANAVRRDGYASAAAFVRTAVEHELKQRQALLQAEREMAATLEHHRNEIRQELKGLAAAINAQFAFLDAFARIMLLCVAEPSAELHEAAKAQAMQRHDKLLRIASAVLKREANASLERLARTEEDNAHSMGPDMGDL